MIGKTKFFNQIINQYSVRHSFTNSDTMSIHIATRKKNRNNYLHLYRYKNKTIDRNKKVAYDDYFFVLMILHEDIQIGLENIQES